MAGGMGLNIDIRSWKYEELKIDIDGDSNKPYS
jgi:hypothetical protein